MFKKEKSIISKMAGVKQNFVCLENAVKRELIRQKREKEGGKHTMLSDRSVMHNQPYNGIRSKYIQQEKNVAAKRKREEIKVEEAPLKVLKRFDNTEIPYDVELATAVKSLEDIISAEEMTKHITQEKPQEIEDDIVRFIKSC